MAYFDLIALRYTRIKITKFWKIIEKSTIVNRITQGCYSWIPRRDESPKKKEWSDSRMDKWSLRKIFGTDCHRRNCAKNGELTICRHFGLKILKEPW